MSPSFLEIPDLPIEIIMNYLDYIAIQSVRKTCWDLRNFIDDKKPGIGMNYIEISQTSNTAVRLAMNPPLVRHSDSRSIDLIYEKLEHGCKIRGTTGDEWKTKIVENLNFLDAALHDFKVALNTQKAPFWRVTVKCFSKTFFEKLEEIMKSQKPFTTESIEIHVKSHEHARQIIQHADPKHLKSIEFYPQEDLTSIHETVELESSKNIQNLSHFATASIHFENQDVETIRAIKEHFLQFHEYDKHLYVSNNVVENMFIDAFGAAFEQPRELEQNWFFNVPGNYVKVLKVVNGYRSFEFDFVEKCEVPEGYMILD
ncbi:hypothetical protein GCK72_021371 [Caenorhabditis remanei]|uniref:F-box domain-containing protein n=1 Tax=Caenorhabditis remanei TaxID=31234 RepID=A0A6A5GHZ3_CAERE|nr:hypothetical protein GCK72_021371 [Caenorhabditis remanei]KAF1754807.1 hypothetical protein GCK72_021371 [Caenorhabditis remanei]